MNSRTAFLLLALGTLLLSGAETSAGPITALTLEECLRLGSERHPALAAAQAGVASATEAVGEAQAPYYPQVDLGAGYHRLQKRAFLPNGLSLPGHALPELIGPLDDWNGGLSSRVMLYDFGERRSGLTAATARRSAAEADATATQADVRLGIQSSFYTLAAMQDLMAVATQNLARTERHLHMAEVRRATGAAPQADALRMQAEVANARLQLIGAQSNVRIARGRLNTAMGRSAESALAITLPQSLPPPAESDLSASLQSALAHRPELASAEQRLVAARAGIETARSARAPKLHADASFGWNDTVWLPETREWQAGVSVDWPIFDGGSRNRKVARSRAELSREEANLENRRLQIRQEVWATSTELERAYASIAANEANVSASTESLRVVQERYQNGAAVITDLLDTQTALARAEASLAAARWDYLSARAGYERAVGTRP